MTLSLRGQLKQAGTRIN